MFAILDSIVIIYFLGFILSAILLSKIPSDKASLLEIIQSALLWPAYLIIAFLKS